MCGATDCPSCGSAQGYAVVRVYDAKSGCYVWVNPDEDDDDDQDDDEEDEE